MVVFNWLCVLVGIGKVPLTMADDTKTAATDGVKAVDDSLPPSGSESSVVAAVQETPKRTWKSYIWDTFDKSPEERRFLFKLDAALMTIASLGYFIKYLDQVSTSPSYEAIQANPVNRSTSTMPSYRE